MAFHESEMIPRSVIPGNPARGRIEIPLYSAPITAKENMRMAMREKKALFMPNHRLLTGFNPRAVPDNEARGFVLDGGPNPRYPEGFKDMFGVTWKWIDVVGGSIVAPGRPMLQDMNEWEEKLVWPDVDSWAWEKQKETSRGYFTNDDLPYVSNFFNGFFERLISLLDFEGAAMALIDEDQKDAVHAFLDKLADLYIKVIDRVCDDYPEVAGFTILDDWGSQRAPFFSLNTIMEMLVPHMKKVADHIHERGRFYDMHCCGKVEDVVPAMIAVGADCWSGQSMNDQAAVYHKYGDRIMIGVDVGPVPPDMPEEDVARMAKAYVDEFFAPGKYAMVGFYSSIQNGRFLSICTGTPA